VASPARAMNVAPMITLLTDFGLEDPYVGVMKAVLWRHCPAARLVDLTHAIPPYDRRAAAFWIERVFGWFEPGTVHLVVVDPGVGSERRALCVAAYGQYFVGPDNGVLGGVCARDPSACVREIDVSRLGSVVPSRTFHGRDVFAPVAAQLASGTIGFDEIGEQVQTVVAPALSQVTEHVTGWHGEVVLVDHFGNALTNLEHPATGTLDVRVGDRRLPIRGTYAEAAPGEAFALFGSFGTLEIAIREGNAASTLALAPGTHVELCRE